MVKLYHEIRERGFKIFLISSRKEYLRSATVENLIEAGYHSWSNLLLRFESYLITALNRNLNSNFTKSKSKTRTLQINFVVLLTSFIL